MSDEITQNEEGVTTETPPVEAESSETPEAEIPASENGTSEAPIAEVETEVPTAEAEAEAPTAEVETEAPTAEAEAEAPTAEAEAEAPTSEATPAMSIHDLRPAMEFNGTVKGTGLYGAFIDIGVGKDGLLHISQMGNDVRNVDDAFKVGDKVTVYVLKADAESARIALSLEKPPERPMQELRVGDVVTGKVVRIENFGAFVEIGAERPGMIHVSELASEFIQSPEDKVTIDQEIQAKVIKINRRKRQIDLSIKALEEEQIQQEVAEAAPVEDEDVPTAMELALRAAMRDADEDMSAMRSSNKRNNRRQRNSRKRRRDLDDALSRTLRDNYD